VLTGRPTVDVCRPESDPWRRSRTATVTTQVEYGTALPDPTVVGRPRPTAPAVLHRLPGSTVRRETATIRIRRG